MPYKQLDTALQDYATFLREKVAAADAPVPATPASVPPVQPAPAPKYASVPDLAEIIALPQDEMRDIVDALQRGAAAGGGAADAAAAAAAPPSRPRAAPAAPDNAFYNAWLDGAEVARLRSPLAQRAGGLPLHQVDGRDRDRARRRRRFRPARRARPTRRISRARRAAARA